MQLGAYSLISPDFEVLCNHRAFNCNRIANNNDNNPTISCFSTYQAGTTLPSCAYLLLSSHLYLHMHNCALEASGFALLICSSLPSHRQNRHSAAIKSWCDGISYFHFKTSRCTSSLLTSIFFFFFPFRIFCPSLSEMVSLH